jgi:glycerol-3-phosphate O-acyltransferase
VQEAIANELSGKTEIVDESALRRKVEKEADAIASEMFGEFRMPVVRFFAWALHKIFKSIYEKIYIDEVMLERLRKIEEQTKIPIVLVPTQRSYLDFLIVSYIFFVYRLKMPNVASDEVLLKTTLIPSLLRSSGVSQPANLGFLRQEGAVQEVQALPSNLN